MDINELRSLLTVAGLLCFLSIVSWAWSGKRAGDPEELDRQRKALLLRR